MSTKGAFLICFACSLVLGGNVLAELGTVQLPIEALGGTYVAVPREINFQASSVAFVPPTELTSVRFHLVGTAVPGELDCTPGGFGDPGVVFNAYVASSGSQTSYWAFALHLEQLEAFDLEVGLLEFYANEVNSILLSGNFELELYASPGIMSDCSLVPPYPEATVTAATLLVEGEYTVPTTRATWEEVKVQFR